MVKKSQKNTSFETIKTVAHSYKLIDTEEDAKKLYDYLIDKANSQSRHRDHIYRCY